MSSHFDAIDHYSIHCNAFFKLTRMLTESINQEIQLVLKIQLINPINNQYNFWDPKIQNEIVISDVNDKSTGSVVGQQPFGGAR